MSPDFETSLMTVVFASQIGVLSFFTPYRRRRNHEFMVTSYPPAEYPRLYPVPKEAMDRRLALFRPVHFAIGVASVAALVAGLLYAGSPAQYGFWMIGCLLAQILPMYISMPWALKVARAFRAMPPPRVRSVELRPWRILDFVSPVWVVLGLGLQALALTCAVVAYQHQARTLRVGVFCGVISSALLLRMCYLLLGPVPLTRTDPYMTPEDTFRVRKRRFTLLFCGGGALAAFNAFILLYGAHFMRFDYGYIWAGMSISFQLTGLALVSAQRRELQTRDFSVYRLESGAQAVR
jgi:hypothetical protein